MWAILTEDGKKGGKWDAEAFFKTGHEQVEKEWKELLSLGLDFDKVQAMDFGCGVGRLTRWLLPYFDRVTGVDSSRNMISTAREVNPDAKRIKWELNYSPSMPLVERESVDFLLSLITLQHIPRKAAERYLDTFAKLLKPKGVCLFQIPGAQIWHRNKPVYAGGADVWKRWYRTVTRKFRTGWREFRDQHGLRRCGDPYFLMTCIPPARVISIFRRNGCRLIRIRRDPSTGENYESFDYVFQKDPLP